MISTLWRVREIRKRLCMRSTTRRAATIPRQGHPSTQAPCVVSVAHVQFLMCKKWIWKELTKQTFRGQWPFDLLVGRGSKQTSRTKHRDILFFFLFFLTERLFVGVRMSECPCALNLERMLLLHQKTFLYIYSSWGFSAITICSESASNLIPHPDTLHSDGAQGWPSC